MAVISTEKGWGAKNLIFKPFPFHSTDFYPSSQVYHELCSLPDLTLTSAASSQLRGWLKPKPHTCVLLGHLCPAAVLAVGTAQPTSQGKPTQSSRAAASPGLLKPQGFRIHWVSVVRPSLWTTGWTALDFTVKKDKSILKRFTSLFVMVSSL